MGVGTGPDAEFFHVVAHGGHAAGMYGRGIAQIGDDFLDLAERDEIAERFLAGEEPDALAAVFGDVGTKEFLGFEASGKKMDVVDEGVADVCRGKRGGKLRLPNALGDPGTCRATTEV